MKALYRTLIAGFYHRNALLFTLLLIFLVFVFRPPTILVSAYFVRPMLEEGRFFAGVLALLLLFQAKAWQETLAALRRPENQFLLALGALPAGALLRHALGLCAGTMAPALAYGAAIAAYSLQAGTWHWTAWLGLQGGVCLGAALHLRHRLWHPCEVRFRTEARPRAWQLGLSYPLFRQLWLGHRRALLWHKAGAALLLIAAAQYHQAAPFSSKGLSLLLLSVALLQAMLPYWLRQSSDPWLMAWRNLPLPRWRWWGAYLLLGSLLFAPEALLAYAWQLPLWAVGSYALGALALFLLAIALLYHQPLQVERYLIRSGTAYVVLFLALLYGLPWWGLSLAGLAFGSWIFFEEFPKWNGFASGE